jgi:hypothetical protein
MVLSADGTARSKINTFVIRLPLAVKVAKAEQQTKAALEDNPEPF